MKRLRSVRNFKQLRCWRPALAIVGLLSILPALVRAESDGPPTKIEVVRGIPYAARGSTHLLADLYIPAGRGPFPAVLLVHGGGWVSGYREQMNHHAGMLARNGFVAVSVSYRLAPRFRFPDPLVDCRDALQWIRQHAEQYQIDTGRLAGFGYSAGAQLICLLGYQQAKQDSGGETEGECPVRLRALVAGGTPCDLSNGTRGALLLSVYLGGTRQKYPERYREASPAAHLSAECPPTFFYHGEIDRMVGADGVRAMSSQLRELGVRSEVYSVAGKGHIAAFDDDGAIQKAAEFLTDVLGPGRDEPATDGEQDG